jgi:dTDP-4-amino-4,6-dideoxygalactose transaminase
MLDLRLEYEYMKEDIDAAISKCLEHQKWIFGPEIRELEEKIAEYTGVRNCIGVSSGTEALVLSLRALAIQRKGDEYFSRDDVILTSPFTFTATGDAIIRAGATPVFVDIDPETFNIDPAKIREYLVSQSQLSKAQRAVGIIPVHLYGQACSMDEILEIAKEFNLFVLEDVAQAFGGMWNGKKLGSIGTAGTFSFFPSKNLGGFGDGGMIAADNDGISELVRMLLKHGGKDKYNVDHIGYNARLDTIQAAVLLAKFAYIDEFNERRAEIARMYQERLTEIKGIILPLSQSQASHVYHQYTIRVLNGKRDDLQRYLKEKGIGSMVYYPFPLHRMRVFQDRCIASGSLAEADHAVDEVLSLPIEPLMKYSDFEYISQTIKEYFSVKGNSHD